MLDLTSTGEITVSKLWRHPSFFLCFVGIPGRDATGQHTVFTTFRLGLSSLIYEFILEIISSLHISYYTVITVSRDFFFLSCLTSKSTLLQEVLHYYSCIPNGVYFTFQEYAVCVVLFCVVL